MRLFLSLTKLVLMLLMWFQHVYQAKLRAQLQAIEDDVSLDQGEKKKRKQNLLLLHNLNAVTGGNGGNGANSGGVTLGSSPTTPTSTISSTMSPNAPSFYPPLDTVESVIGQPFSRTHCLYTGR